LAAHTRGGTAAGALVGGGYALDPGEAARLTTTAITVVETFLSANPLRPGMPKASLASQLGLNLDLLTVLLSQTDRLTDVGADVATAGFAVELDPGQRSAWEAARRRLEAGLAVPPVGELGLPTELIYARVRTGSLVRISGELVYLPGQIATVIGGLGELPTGFTVADFRDHFGLTRKYAVPLLEWLDGEGHTARSGDGRTVTGV
jgi:selenocysteine-specific elongation factor